MHKPIALIVANVVHEVTAEAWRLEQANGRAPAADAVAAAVARRALCQIGHEGALPDVERALAAIGAIASLDEAQARVAADRDQAGIVSPAGTEPAGDAERKGQ